MITPPGLWEEACALAGCNVDVTAGPSGDGLSAAAAIADWLGRGLDPGRITLSSDAGGSLPRFDDEGELVAMEVGLRLCEKGDLLLVFADQVTRSWEQVIYFGGHAPPAEAPASPPPVRALEAGPTLPTARDTRGVFLQVERDD